MNITPLDIRKQEFKKSFNGYDKHEVESFLGMIADQMEDLIRSNMQYSESIRDLDRKIDDYRRMEQTLQDTLTSAQKTTDELRKNAQKEAELISRNARIEAEHYLQSAKMEANDLKSEIKTLITMKNNFIAKFKGMIDAYIKLLEQEVLDHKVDVNEFNKVLNEPPENVQNIGSLFKQKENDESEDNRIKGILRE